MADPIAIAQLRIAQNQAEAAWAAVTATWASAIIAALVIGSAFATLALQRYLDRRREERRRQYNNLSVLIESMLAIRYVDFCNDYLGAALARNKLVAKHPIIFYLAGYYRNLEISSAAEDVGPGPTSLASRTIVIAREVVDKVRAICPDDLLSADQITALQRFIATIQPDLATVWQAFVHHHSNIVSGAEGQWAEKEFCRRSRTPKGGQDVIDMLKAGRYVPLDDAVGVP